MRILILLLLLTSPIFSQDNAAEFDLLRENYLGKKVPLHFVAELSPQSAQQIINNRVPKPYRVEIDYNVRRGVDLWVRDTEPFYEYMLQSYAHSINVMLLPILSSPAYLRIREKSTIQKIESNIYEFRYPKGDLEVRYLMSVDKNGLFDQITYWEGKKKEFDLSIKWTAYQNFFIPSVIKGVSYQRNRKAAQFVLRNPKII